MEQDTGASAEADRAATPSEPSPEEVSGKAGVPCAWRHTETAPKDGTRIFARYHNTTAIVRWGSGPKVLKNGRRSKTEVSEFWTDGRFRCRAPDGWVPLSEAEQVSA